MYVVADTNLCELYERLPSASKIPLLCHVSMRKLCAVLRYVNELMAVISKPQTNKKVIFLLVSSNPIFYQECDRLR